MGDERQDDRLASRSSRHRCSMSQKPIVPGSLKCRTFGRNRYRPRLVSQSQRSSEILANGRRGRERERTIPYNDHSLRVGVEPANTRKHVFKISRVRQVPLARKASTTFAYARFTPPPFRVRLRNSRDCRAIRSGHAEFLRRFTTSRHRSIGRISVRKVSRIDARSELDRDLFRQFPNVEMPKLWSEHVEVSVVDFDETNILDDEINIYVFGKTFDHFFRVYFLEVIVDKGIKINFKILGVIQFDQVISAF